MLDRFACYELCVQSPRHIVTMLRAIHAGLARDGAGAAASGGPVVLREDFCGTAAVSRRWCESEHTRAVAVDLDAQTLAWAQERVRHAGLLDRIAFHRADSTAKPIASRAAASALPSPHAAPPSEACDAVFVGNFSIGYIHRRADLMRYLRHSLDRLRAGVMGPGVFVCDTYGGAGAFRLGQTRRRHPGKGHELIHYLWCHEEADPITGMVTNSISFDIESTLTGQIEVRLPRTFVYRWRLWSIAELREAMLEVGFDRVEVYRDANLAPATPNTPGEPARPVMEPSELGEDWVVMVVGRA